jgi:putative flippase GtrA
MTLKRQLITFIIVGMINTLVGYGLFCSFIALGLHHLLAITLSFIVGVLFNFQTIGRFVFQKHDRRLMTKFILVYAFLYVFNVVCLEGLTLFMHNWYINGAIVTVFAAIISFILNKCWVFKK